MVLDVRIQVHGVDEPVRREIARPVRRSRRRISSKPSPKFSRRCPVMSTKGTSGPVVAEQGRQLAIDAVAKRGVALLCRRPP